MLLGGAGDQHQPVLAVEVLLDIHPVQVFDAHVELQCSAMGDDE